MQVKIRLWVTRKKGRVGIGRQPAVLTISGLNITSVIIVSLVLDIKVELGRVYGVYFYVWPLARQIFYFPINFWLT